MGHVMARAIEGFPIALNGIEIRHLAVGAEFPCPRDIFAGLEAKGLVELAELPRHDPVAQAEAVVALLRAEVVDLKVSLESAMQEAATAGAERDLARLEVADYKAKAAEVTHQAEAEVARMLARITELEASQAPRALYEHKAERARGRK